MSLALIISEFYTYNFIIIKYSYLTACFAFYNLNHALKT